MDDGVNAGIGQSGAGEVIPAGGGLGEMPPLDAGDRAEELPPLVPVSEPAGDLSTEARAGADNTGQGDVTKTPASGEAGTEGGDGDDELLRIIQGESSGGESPTVPEGVDPEVWSKFVEFQEQSRRQAPPPGVSQEEWDAFQQSMAAQGAQDVALQQPAFDVSEEDFDAIVNDPEKGLDTFKGVLEKHAAANAARINQGVGQIMARVIEDFDVAMTNKVEQMLYLFDAYRENPELENYPKAFKAAFDKAKAKASHGDLKGPVISAVNAVKRELGRAEAVKKSGTVVDVRGAQKPKPTPGPSSRETHRAGSGSSDAGVDWLAKMNLGG